jgi:uronate dehydrogenase
MNPRIVVTGAAGQLGRVLRARLPEALAEQGGGWNRVKWCWSDLIEPAPLSGAEASAGHSLALCNLADSQSVHALLENAGAVIHLGGLSTEADWTALVAANVTGLANLYTAAAAHGVDRVLFASSHHAVGMYERGMTLNESAPPKPDSRYGVTKVFGEAVASLYAAKHGVRSWCMRIGSCTPFPRNPRMLSTWLSHDDWIRLVVAGLCADYTFEIVYGVSANDAGWWDNRRALENGYAPQDNAAEHAGSIVDSAEDPVALRFQGGHFAAAEWKGPPA